MQARAVALDMLLAVSEGRESHRVFAAELSKYPDMERQGRALTQKSVRCAPFRTTL